MCPVGVSSGVVTSFGSSVKDLVEGALRRTGDGRACRLRSVHGTGGGVAGFGMGGPPTPRGRVGCVGTCRALIARTDVQTTCTGELVGTTELPRPLGGVRLRTLGF